MCIDQSQPEGHQALDFRTSKERSAVSQIPVARKAVPPELVAPVDLTPGQTAERLAEWSTAKSTLSADRLIVLGLLAGAFIAVGGAFFTGVMAVSSLGHGPTRLLGGIVFSCGLLLVCVSGAELSTGNCMLFTAWASRRLTLIDLGRNLLISYAANAAGAMAFAMLIGGSGLLQSEHGRTAAAIAEAKMNLSFEHAFIRGILCNVLVCIAVWMIMAARTIPSKLAGLIFPISAFITLGFEHSIAKTPWDTPGSRQTVEHSEWRRPKGPPRRRARPDSASLAEFPVRPRTPAGALTVLLPCPRIARMAPEAVKEQRALYEPNQDWRRPWLKSG